MTSRRTTRPTRPALLELVAPGQLDEDLDGLDRGLALRGLEARGVLAREVERGTVDVAGAGLVAGRLPVVHAALRRLGVPVPAPLDHLDAPEALLGRRVWASTLGAVAAGLELRGEPVFVKPRGVAKRFTGRVVHDPVDLRSLPVSAPATPVWCSEVVDIVVEHRVFVCRGGVRSVAQYAGPEGSRPTRTRVGRVVEPLLPRLTAGCAVDVAELRNGRLVLVEVNDGFSLGRYGVDPGTYLDVLVARWTELTGG